MWGVIEVIIDLILCIQIISEDREKKVRLNQINISKENIRVNF